MSTLAENFERVEAQIEAAANRAGRDRKEIELIAVSKTWPAEVVREATELHRVFGENKVQEAIEKIPQLSERLIWHFIGVLQKNKIRKALPLFDMLHGVSSVELAQQIDRIAGEEGIYPKVFLQVNIGDEGTKSGFQPEELHKDLETMLSLERLEIQGLMTIPPPVKEADDARKFFVGMRELRDQLESEFDVKLPSLSMGMSHDFEIAIEEGATHVRVGTALFGKRSYNKP